MSNNKDDFDNPEEKLKDALEEYEESVMVFSQVATNHRMSQSKKSPEDLEAGKVLAEAWRKYKKEKKDEGKSNVVPISPKKPHKPKGG